MTGKTLSKLKSVLIVMLAALMSLALVFFAACGSTSSTDDDDDRTYSKVEHDEQEMTNGNFEFGTASVESKDFPYTSINGWTRSLDNSAASSRVNSGIIDTSEKSWGVLLETLIDNSTFKAWALDKYDIDEDALKEEAKKEENLGADADSEDVDEWVDGKIKEALEDKFVNPATHDGAEGGKVLMLNNYTSNLGEGTAQKVTSTKTFTLKPDTYGKLSVWVKTGDIAPANNVDYGANIRLTNTVASVNQDEYAISNIVANEWTKYTFYVKANDFADTTVKLVLGLGYGKGHTSLTDNYVEGSVYFDDAVYEELETLPAEVTQTPDKISLVSDSSSEKMQATVVNNTAYLDLTTENFFWQLNADAETKQTVSNTGASTVPDGAAFTKTASGNGFKVEHTTPNSTTTTLKSSNFVVVPGEYALITFKLNMKLDKFQRTGLTVYVFDKDPNNSAVENHQVTLSNVMVEDETTYTIIVKNNFAKDTLKREFYLSFIFGPVNVATTTDTTLYTKGSYEITELNMKTGETEEPEVKDTDYNVYSLINRTSTNVYNVAAYAGYKADHTEDEDTTNYSFRVAYSDEGTITHSPAEVAGYTGVKDYAETYTGAGKNSAAGLINTEYDYADLTGLKTALDHNGEENIQPLMIYNETATSYGYVNAASTIAANSYATVSVRVRVTGNAAAYIYLVNTAKGDDMLKPLGAKFTADNGTECAFDYAAKVTADMMDGDGWATVKFYIGSGNTPLSYRLELWNGERVSASQEVEGVGSQGYVFFNDVTVGTSFEEETVLSDAIKNAEIDHSDEVYYTRKLTELEEKYNSEQKSEDDKIKYTKKVVYASDKSADGKAKFIFGVLNTIDPTENDPYGADDEEPETPANTGCNNADASTLILSISSIVLAVALVAAIIALVVKAVLRKRKANKSDAKSHYKVTSRNKVHTAAKAKSADVIEDPEEETDEDEVPEEEEKEEYTYGEVLEDFGDDEVKTEEPAEEETEKASEETTEEETNE